MVKHYPETLDAVFSALADPTRRALLQRLAGGATRGTDLAAPFEISLPAVSRHLRVLEEAGLIGREIEGRVHQCHLEATPMKEAADWINVYRHFWEARLDSLVEYLHGMQARQKADAGESAPAPRTEGKPETEGDEA